MSKNPYAYYHQGGYPQMDFVFHLHQLSNLYLYTCMCMPIIFVISIAHSATPRHLKNSWWALCTTFYFSTALHYPTRDLQIMLGWLKQGVTIT